MLDADNCCFLGSDRDPGAGDGRLAFDRGKLSFDSCHSLQSIALSTYGLRLSHLRSI
jgi:hypothetical protein